MSAVLEVRNLHYRYEDGTPALDGVDFELNAGETVALLGANGSGKTTFVLHLNGLLEGEGQIRVCGLELNRKNLPVIRRKLGLVFQDSDSQLFMPTVIEDVAFAPLNFGRTPSEAREIAQRALKRVGMEFAMERAPFHLSAGEKKRVAIAGILAMDPEILVLDEPTTYLDPIGQRDLIGLLSALPQAKILVTHDLEFAAELASRAVFFQKGRAVATGTVSAIVDRFQWGLRASGLRSDARQ